MRPLVTIGLPFFNPGRWLEGAIKSIFAQTYTNWELLAIDDGSYDQSYELCRSIQDPRVRVIRDGVRKGLPARLNQIAQMASGKYLARMDADDLIHPERLERQVKFLEDHPGIDVVATGAYLLSREGLVIGVWRGNVPTPDEVFSRGGYLHPSIVGRTEWFKANPYALDYPRAEDRELFVRTLGQSRFAVLDEPLYFYRWDGGNVEKLLVGYRSERKVIWKYGPMRLGWYKTATLLGRSLGKEAVVRFLSIFGGAAFVKRISLKRHSEGIDKAAMEQVLEVLRQIYRQPVPGWGK